MGKSSERGSNNFIVTSESAASVHSAVISCLKALFPGFGSEPLRVYNCIYGAHSQSDTASALESPRDHRGELDVSTEICNIVIVTQKTLRRKRVISLW